MNKGIKILVLVILATMSSVFSYVVSGWIAEHYFFDKFVYYKRLDYGYFVPDKFKSFIDFRDRARDVIPYLKDARQFSKQYADANVLGSTDRQEFTIAFIGDSFVWGQGVKFEDTVTQVLERKLNKIKLTNVLALAISGDNIMENIAKYVLSRRFHHVDLYVFMPLINDVLLNTDREKYALDLYDEIIDPCAEKTGIEPITAEPVDEMNEEKKTQGMRKEFEASKNSTNICIFDSVYQLLPRDNAIYVLPYEYKNENTIAERIRIEQTLHNNNLYIVYARDGKNIPQYTKYWENPDKYFRVSSVEVHPSKLAHRMYADLLYQEITTNPRWGFVENK